MPRLIIREKGRERVIELDIDKVTIGRSKANAVPIADARASRAHCAIEKTESGWLVVDLGSSNGTMLNREPVQKALLALGDVVSIGETEIHFGRVIEDPLPAREVDTSSLPIAEPVELQDEEPAPAPAVPQVQVPVEDLSLHTKSGAARFYLEIIRGPRAGEKYPLGGQTFTIGRKASNTLGLDDERASGNHAQVSREGSLWVLTDLGSTNGTTINGNRIKRAILEHGTVFVIGHSELRFVDSVGAKLPGAAPSGGIEPAGPRGLPSDADFEKIDVEKALKRKESNPLVTFAFTIAALLLIVSLIYFAFQVFEGFFGRGPTGPKPGNMVPNWSFEENAGEQTKVLPGWQTLPAGWSVDRKVAKSGRSSLRLDLSANDKPDQVIAVSLKGRPVTSDRQYQVRAQVRLKAARKAGIRVRWSDPLNPYFTGETFSELVEGSGGWKTLRWNFVPPRKATRMDVSLCGFGNTGTVWFDDIELYESKLEAEVRKSARVALGNAMEITVDPRGTWSFYRLGVLAFWDAQLFIKDRDGEVDAFSRQGLSNIQKRAAVSGGSMLYLGGIYEPYTATWVPLTQEIYSSSEKLSVRYKLSGDFGGAGTYGVSLRARPEVFSIAEVEVSTPEGVRFFKDEFNARGALEMVWTLGKSIISFNFSVPLDVSVKKGKHGFEVALSRPVGVGKETEFVIDFSEVSLRQAQKISSVFSRIAALRAEGRLQEAIKLADRGRVEVASQMEAKRRLDSLVREMEVQGDTLVLEAQDIYKDFTVSRHPVVVETLRRLVERIGVAFPESKLERSSKRLLSQAQETLQKDKTRRRQAEAKELLAKGNSCRELGLLGLAAEYYEYVRDKFPGTEWEKDAKALLERLESQMRTEDRW